jgi:predicted nucleic acid-binding protein
LILVDSSVWIDYFRGTINEKTDALDGLLGRSPLIIGDLILAEVLQGCPNERVFLEVGRVFRSLEMVELCGREVAEQAAIYFRTLRRRGITVRKTIDTVIATRCILSGYTLLHNDRDFDAFAKFLGLRVMG